MMDTMERYGDHGDGRPARREATTLADLVERILDKGIVVAGDIAVSVIDIELLTIKLRLLIASVDKAREMGIDWWASDPALSSRARELQDRNEALEDRVRRLEAALERAGLPAASEEPASQPAPREERREQ